MIDSRFFLMDSYDCKWYYDLMSKDQSYRIMLDSFVNVEPSKKQVIVISSNNRDKTDLIHKLKYNARGGITDYSISNKTLLEVYKIYNEGLNTLSEEIEINKNRGKKEYKATFYDREGNFLRNEDINQLILDKSNCKQLCDLLNINEDKYNEFIFNEQIKVKNLKDSVYSSFVL